MLYGYCYIMILLLFAGCKHDEYHTIKKSCEKQEAIATKQLEAQIQQAQSQVAPAAQGAPATSSLPESLIDAPPLKPVTSIVPPVRTPKSDVKKTKLSKNQGTLKETELDFVVENKSGQTVYVSCFSWERKNPLGYWRWDKSPVYRIGDDASVVINVDTISDKQDRESVYGYLAIHTDSQEAEDAIFELLPDSKKLDLDVLSKLKGKKVTLSIEKYGFKGEFFEYDFLPRHDGKQQVVPDLDFVVENKTGKTIFVVGFVYEKRAKGTWVAAEDDKDDMVVWRWDKTPMIKLSPGTVGMIDVDTITSNRDRSYVRGYLAIFDADEERKAQESTYELLETYRKINIGDLNMLQGKKVVIDIERYGMEEDFLDYVVKPVSKIDFKKLYQQAT